MTAANGLDGLVQYTEAAATDVSTQSGKVPVPLALDTPVPTTTTTVRTTTTVQTTTTESSTTLGGANPSGGSGASSSSSGSTQTTGNQTSSGTTGSTSKAQNRPYKAKNPSGHAGPTINVAPAASTSRTLAVGGGFGGLALPTAALVAVVGAGTGVWEGRRRRKQRA
jgi:hypothetical protein